MCLQVSPFFFPPLDLPSNTDPQMLLNISPRTTNNKRYVRGMMLQSRSPARLALLSYDIPLARGLSGKGIVPPRIRVHLPLPARTTQKKRISSDERSSLRRLKWMGCTSRMTGSEKTMSKGAGTILSASWEGRNLSHAGGLFEQIMRHVAACVPRSEISPTSRGPHNLATLWSEPAEKCAVAVSETRCRPVPLSPVYTRLCRRQSESIQAASESSANASDPFVDRPSKSHSWILEVFAEIRCSKNMVFWENVGANDATGYIPWPKRDTPGYLSLWRGSSIDDGY